MLTIHSKTPVFKDFRASFQSSYAQKDLTELSMGGSESALIMGVTLFQQGIEIPNDNLKAPMR